MNAIVIDPASDIGAALAAAARDRRIVFLAGLPGTGKSLYLQQQALLAHRAGRRVHLMQWDTARSPFETEATLARYPEVDGVTHAAIRKAVGSWARGAVADWARTHPDPADMLIGELPVVGNRFTELLERRADDAEPLLAGPESLFFLPVPSRGLRAHIEAARASTIAAPGHEREARDAPPAVVTAHWQAVDDLADRMGLARGAAGYDPDRYRAVFARILTHRNTCCLEADRVWPTAGSVYDLDMPVRELLATPAEVAAAFAGVERDFPGDSCAAAVEGWFDRVVHGA